MKNNASLSLSLVSLCVIFTALTPCTSNTTAKGMEEIFVSGMRMSAAAEPELWREKTQKNKNDFDTFKTNPTNQVSEAPVSTFSADVDTANYSFTAL